MEEIENEIKSLIDNSFNVDINLTGNKLLDQTNKGKKLDEITESVTNKCVELLNNKYPAQTKEFLNTGFVNQYLKEKIKNFLLR